ncbi:MAG TPA: hypothetical protein VIT20_03990 [Propionibacteriaceae bacterium]
MNGLQIVFLVLVILLSAGWRLSWMATRLDRAHYRVERAWAALDAALVRRAQRAAELACSPSLDPAAAVLLSDAAAAALEPELAPGERERAESDLSHVLALVVPGRMCDEQDRASLVRRLHNDAVRTARSLQQRRTVRVFRLAGRAGPPRTFEMADPRELGWPRGGA